MFALEMVFFFSNIAEWLAHPKFYVSFCISPFVVASSGRKTKPTKPIFSMCCLSVRFLFCCKTKVRRLCTCARDKLKKTFSSKVKKAHIYHSNEMTILLQKQEIYVSQNLSFYIFHKLRSENKRITSGFSSSCCEWCVTRQIRTQLHTGTRKMYTNDNCMW